MDSLSFLMEVLDVFVVAAKSVVVALGIVAILILIRHLPKRIRSFLTAVIALVLFYALLSDGWYHSMTFALLRTSALHTVLVRFVSITVLFVSEVISVVRSQRRSSFNGEELIFDSGGYSLRLSRFSLSTNGASSYLKLSPVMRQ